MTRLYCLHCESDIPFNGNPHSSLAAHVDAAHEDGMTHAWLPDRDYLLELPPATSELDDPALTTTLTVRGNAIGEPELVEDYLIAVVPQDMASPPPETPANPKVSYFLLRLGDDQVKAHGWRLRSASWYVTRSPAVVEQRSSREHCASCHAAVDQALALMRDKPGTVIALGVFSLAHG